MYYHYKMKKNFSILFVFSLTIFYAGQNKKYPEIINSGYTGKIHSLTIKIFNDSIKDKSSDSLISVRIRHYAKDGNATKEFYQRDSNSQITDYEYKNGVRTGYTLSKDGEIQIRAKIIQQKTEHIINVYDIQNRLVSSDIYKYNDQLKIKNNTRIIYNNQNGKITDHTITDYYYDGDGFISGYDKKDLLTSKTDSYRYKIVEKDEHKNPGKLILLKNKVPFQIHTIAIEYNE